MDVMWGKLEQPSQITFNTENTDTNARIGNEVENWYFWSYDYEPATVGAVQGYEILSFLYENHKGTNGWQPLVSSN